MLNENRMREINEGWEKYYANAGNDQLWKEEAEPFLTKNVDKLANLNSSSLVLDVGCGDGRNSWLWLERNQPLVCLDVAKTGLVRMLEQAQQRNLPTPVLMAVDFLADTLVEKQFDVVQCFDALAQINDSEKSIKKLCALAKSGGYILFNFFTPGDCAYGQGECVDARTYVYKDTLFKFLTADEVRDLLPSDVEIVTSEVRRWDDPPHGEFRPEAHTHEAVFYLLRRK